MTGRQKRVAILGLGQFGSELAKSLARRCEVLAIDIVEARVNASVDMVQRALILDGRDFASLSAVINADFDEAVVCMGENLEASLLTALNLKKVGVKSIYAKATNEDHAAILRSMGITNVIFPERETAQRMAAKIVNPNLLDFLPLEGDYQVTELAPPDSFCGKTLMDLDIRKQYGIFVVAIRELVPSRFVLLPDAHFCIKPSDILVVLGHQNDLLALEERARKNASEEKASEAKAGNDKSTDEKEVDDAPTA